MINISKKRFFLVRFRTYVMQKSIEAKTAQHSPAARDTLRARCLRRAPDAQQSAPGWAIPSASLLGQVWSQRIAPSPNRRVFRRFAWLGVGSGKAASSRPAHPRVTHTVGQQAQKSSKKHCSKDGIYVQITSSK